MSAPIPSFFKIRCVLVIISLLLFFMLIGMTRMAFALDCSKIDITVKYYKTSAAYYAAVNAATGYANSTAGSCYAGIVCDVCLGIPLGKPYTNKYTVINTISTGVGFVLDTSCDDGADADGECECKDQKDDLAAQCGSTGYTILDEDTCSGRCNDCVQSAQQQCGDKEIEWNEDGECSYRCKDVCQDMHDRLSYDCGGSDKYWLTGQKNINPDGSTSEQCAGACGDPPDSNRDTDGDGNPDRTDDDIDGDGVPNDQDDDIDGDGIPNGSDSAPTVPGGVDMSKPPGQYGAENPDPPPPSSDPDNPDPTFACIEKYNNKVKECGEAGIASWSNETCTGRCNGSNPCTKEQMDAADAQCPKGYTMNSDCTASCKTCSQFESDCVESCKPAAVKTNFCEEQNGSVVDTLCECENASGCQQYKASCDSSCAQNNCGGVKTYQCQEDSTGKITSKTCECNDCGKPDVPDPKNPEPEDPDDLAGWLKGIKRDTEQISESTASVKQSVDGLKGSIDGLKDALSDVTIKGSGIGTLTGDGSLGDGGSVTGSGYGTAPADGDLPATTSFGTFTPRAPGSAGDYGGQIASKLDSLSITASGPVCSFNFSFPVPHLSGLSLSFTWENYPVDFCQYESLFVVIGNLLVFFTALNELYKFA